MSQPISDIVTISTTLAAESVARTNFGIILLVDEQDDASPPFTGRTKSYASLVEMATDNYSSGDYAYDAAGKIFSQNPKVSSLKVGLKYITTTPDASWTAAMTAIRNADSAFYGISIKSTTLADQKEVADWVQTQSDPVHVFFIRTNDTDVYTIAAPTAGIATVSNTGTLGEFNPTTVPGLATLSNYTLDVTIDGGTLQQLDDISINVADDWNDIAAAIQTSLQAATSSTETCTITAGKIQITSATTGESSTVVIADGTGTGTALLAAITALGADYTATIDTPVDGAEDIAYYVNNNNYNRSSVWYSDNALTNYIECAAMGERYPKDAAVGTWMFKTLVGITTDTFTSSERTTALTKAANLYVERASIDMSEEGTVGNGWFIDELRGIDQLEAWIQEDLFELLVTVEKVPGNDLGISQIQGKLEYSLGRAETYIINTDWTTSVPEQADRTTADKNNRHLSDVTYTATLQGAIHTIEIAGTLTR